MQKNRPAAAPSAPLPFAAVVNCSIDRYPWGALFRRALRIQDKEAIPFTSKA